MQRATFLLSKPHALGLSSLMNRKHGRRYVGNFQSTESVIDPVNRPLKSTHQLNAMEPSTAAKIEQEVSSQYDSEPAFEIVSSGVGSALRVKLPPQTEITASSGSPVSVSSHVSSKFTLDDNMVGRSGLKLDDDLLFYQKIYTEQHPGEILLAPQRMGEITTIQLRGSSKYILRRDVLLAKTAKVVLAAGMDGAKGAKIGLAKKLVHTLTGPGTIAISYYGGLYRVSLAAGEDYLVNPRNLVLWESRTVPTRLRMSDPVVPSNPSPWRRYTFARNIFENPSIQPKLQKMKTMAKSFHDLILGTPEFVKLKGPGDFYIASRVEPRFEKLRLTNAHTSINDSVSQLFEKASAFPDQAPHQDVTTQRIAEASALSDFGKRKHHRPVVYAEKSIDGKPSFFAEIGPYGKVTFVSAKE